MPNKINRFIYVSGPPCAGKSTFSREVVKEVKKNEYIIGADYWIQNDQYGFSTRFKKQIKILFHQLTALVQTQLFLNGFLVMVRL
jgi:uridine kinase